MKLVEEPRRGRLGLEEQIPTRSDDSSEEALRNKRRRSGVCWGVMGEEVMGSREEEEEALRGGEDIFVSSSGGQEEAVSWTPQSPDSVFLEEAELLLKLESEGCLWAESRVLSAASIFLSNIFLVS